jgi:hypothetical protein
MMRPGERPAELVDLQGAWRRDGRAISGNPPVEVADVLWLQVGRFFCDLRTPYPPDEPTDVLDQPQAFSGTVVIGGGLISFHHDLDSLARDPAHPDQGTVHRKDNVMYERGPGFEERWIATSLPGDDIAIAEFRLGDGVPQARLIRIGSVALAVWAGATPGGAQFNKANGWLAERRLHGEDGVMGTDEAARRIGRDEALPGGWVTVDPGEV